MIEPPGDSVIGAAAGRRRYLTVMFSDLSDSTRLAGLMEAEDFSALLATMRRLRAHQAPRREKCYDKVM